METTPEFFQGGYYNSSQFTPEKRLSDAKNVDHFIIDDLLDFPNDDGMVADEISNFHDATNITGTSTDSNNSTLTALHDNSCNSSFSGSTELQPHFPAPDIRRNFSDGQFSSELCVPYDDLAELEWLSNFVEESFSSEDLQKLQLISGMKARNGEGSETHHHQFQPEPNRAATATPTQMFRPEMAVPAKARSKRSRAAPCNWASRLLMVTPSSPAPTPIPTAPAMSMSSSSESDIASSSGGKKTAAKATPKKKELENGSMGNGEGRKCLHCATDKTPQWRTGPMGPKTLCNACGVRYKSGRLVPEYRPAASPTFLLTKHSNSHRKVLELRRQKEMVRAQQHQQQLILHPNIMFDVSNGPDDYLIHQHIGPDFRQLI